MSMCQHLTFVHFNDERHLIEFRVTKNTHHFDLKSKLDNILRYPDNQKVVKLNYRSPLIDNEGNMHFNMFELKAVEDLRVCGVYFTIRRQIVSSRWMRWLQDRTKIF